MLWCRGVYCGWGNHTTARHDEAMVLQETHLTQDPPTPRRMVRSTLQYSYAIAVGRHATNSSGLHTMTSQGQPNGWLKESSGVENKKARTKNNVNAVNWLLAAKGVDTQNLSFKRDFGYRGTRSGNTSPPATWPITSPPAMGIATQWAIRLQTSDFFWTITPNPQPPKPPMIGLCPPPPPISDLCFAPHITLAPTPSLLPNSAPCFLCRP